MAGSFKIRLGMNNSRINKTIKTGQEKRDGFCTVLGNHHSLSCEGDAVAAGFFDEIH
jgi:hypothetical protein